MGVGGVPGPHRDRADRRDREHRDAARLRLRGRRRHPAGGDRPRGSGLRRDGAGRRRQPRRRRRPRPARGQGTHRLPLSRRPAPDGVRAERLERHRRYLRPRRRRLLLVPGAQRRHDRLLGLQHRGTGGRAGARPASRCRRVRRRRAARPRPRAGRARRRRPAGGGGRRRGEGRRAAGVHQGPHRALQVPAVDRVRGRAAPDLHRQGAALPAARAPAGGVSMRIAVIGGGPGGLYFSALAKAWRRGAGIWGWGRNAPDDTFGFGVVFSDETLGGIEHADPVIHARMAERFARWDDVDVHFRGTSTTVGGQGFAAMSRKDLLRILQERCAELGVRVDFRTEAPDVDALAGDFDLVIASDGANSAVRTKYADVFGPTIDLRRNKYMWLGTDKVFDAFKFYVCETPFGVLQVHGYPYDAGHSTFIVEMHDDVWRAAGFGSSGGRTFPPGVSDDASIARIREMLGEVLDGHAVLANNSKWQSFPTVTNRTWRHGNVVLLGDAAHTAHFSIGSGTKLAMEDALALVACLHEQPDVPTALEAYEAERRPVVLSTQRAAQASLQWFENIAQYVGQAPEQFAINIVTRSRRITYDNLMLRDPEFVARVDRWFARSEVPADLARPGE